MSRKQIGLRMKDETRDQLERVRGGLSRTDYIEGAVLAQIARDLKKGESWNEVPITTDDGMPKDIIMPVPQTLREGELRCKGKIVRVGTLIDGRIEGWVIQGGDYPGVWRLDDGSELFCGWSVPELEQIASLVNKFDNNSMVPAGMPIPKHFSPLIRSSGESKSGVLPVPKKAVKGRK